MSIVINDEANEANIQRGIIWTNWIQEKGRPMLKKNKNKKKTKKRDRKKKKQVGAEEENGFMPLPLSN